MDGLTLVGLLLIAAAVGGLVGLFFYLGDRRRSRW